MPSSAAPLSDTDAAFLYRYGTDVAEDSVDAITETALVALYGVIFAFAIVQFQRGNLSKPGPPTHSLPGSPRSNQGLYSAEVVINAFDDQLSGMYSYRQPAVYNSVGGIKLCREHTHHTQRGEGQYQRDALRQTTIVCMTP
ncbi:hypothetical protein B0H19DRAFT_1259669 [Mycena capillaripes]|nr:hypothetical protein B0H19DRAFT_1259669 [Mycena capillaripes]